MCGGGWAFVYSSPCSSRELVPSTSGIFANCGRFRIRRAVNQPFLWLSSGFPALIHCKPKTWSYAFIWTTKSSDLSTGVRRSNTESRDWTFGSRLQKSSPGQLDPRWRPMPARVVGRVSHVGVVIVIWSLHCSRLVLWLAACCCELIVQGLYGWYVPNPFSPCCINICLTSEPDFPEGLVILRGRGAVVSHQRLHTRLGPPNSPIPTR